MSMKIHGQDIETMRLKSQLFDIHINIETLEQRKRSLMNQLTQLIIRDKEKEKLHQNQQTEVVDKKKNDK